MLKKILSGKSCAKCRICCIFDSSDIWETPVFTEEIKNKIIAKNPNAEFIPKDGGFILNAGELADGQIFTCPALTEKGCMLGDDKPFDCRIWPYRIMNVGEKRAITIASVCPELYNRPLSQLLDFLKDGLAQQIFSYADSHPEIVKPYEQGYPVLIFDN